MDSRLKKKKSRHGWVVALVCEKVKEEMAVTKREVPRAEAS